MFGCSWQADQATRTDGLIIRSTLCVGESKHVVGGGVGDTEIISFSSLQAAQPAGSWAKCAGPKVVFGRVTDDRQIRSKPIEA